MAKPKYTGGGSKDGGGLSGHMSSIVAVGDRVVKGELGQRVRHTITTSAAAQQPG
jgi:hypothetical protein